MTARSIELLHWGQDGETFLGKVVRSHMKHSRRLRTRSIELLHWGQVGETLLGKVVRSQMKRRFVIDCQID